ncbi:hypothetical protein LCGC14_1189680 [marine sediment metagenome]|uniref:Uncharacterized protein n=1 Tax=marine sediment metagenome TaxID=412755 RepID=A0A0F9PQ72_9ZZZZ
MTDADRIVREVLEANPAVQELLADMLGYDNGRGGDTILELQDGTQIRWQLKDNQTEYTYWQKGKKIFAYTPWKDTKGWYWSFTWRDRDRYPRKVRKHRKRKDAKKRAYKMYDPTAYPKKVTPPTLLEV